MDTDRSITERTASHDVHTARESSGKRTGIAFLVVLFFLAFLPAVFQISTYHSDERFYTDAALLMVKNGDYITPHYPTGELRTQKPVLTYWITALSYKCFGISLFSSRLPFLIAGSLVVWLSWMISRLVFRRNDYALLAAAVLCSNTVLISSSLRSTPDILLCLFSNISLYGFIGIIFDGRRSFAYYCMAYFGAALAVESKGVLGLAPVGFAFIFVLMRKKSDVRVRDLRHAGIMILAAIAAVSWYAGIFIKHGDSALWGFFSDQAGARFSDIKYHLIDNAVTYVFGLLRHFFPWSLVILAGVILDRKKAASFFRLHKEIVIFIFGWYSIFFLVFVSGNINRTRYMLPAYPMIAVLVSALVVHLSNGERQNTALRTAYNAWLIMVGICSTLLVLAGFFIDARFVFGGLLLLAAVAVLFHVSVKTKKISESVGLAVSILFVLSAVTTCIHPVFRVSPASGIAKCVQEKASGTTRILSLGLENKYVGQLRILLAGKYEIADYPQGLSLEAGKGRPIIIVSEKFKPELDSEKYSIYPCGYRLKSPKPRDIARFFTVRDRNLIFSELQDVYYIATERN